MSDSAVETFDSAYDTVSNSAKLLNEILACQAAGVKEIMPLGAAPVSFSVIIYE